MKSFKTIQEIYNASGTQVTAQDVLNRRLYIKGEGWQDIELSAQLGEDIASNLSELFGGHTATKNRIKSVLNYSRPQHWGLKRTVIEDYGNGARWCYIAGQDGQWEANEIRTSLKK